MQKSMLPMPHYVNKRESNLCQYKYDNNVDNHNIAKKKVHNEERKCYI